MSEEKKDKKKIQSESIPKNPLGEPLKMSVALDSNQAEMKKRKNKEESNE